jgi:hypothetical protein
VRVEFGLVAALAVWFALVECAVGRGYNVEEKGLGMSGGKELGI